MERLSARLQGDISFEKIHFKPFTTLVLKNVAITDRNPSVNPHDSTSTPVDTLFKAQYIIARFTLEGLRHQDCLHLNKAYISNAQMNLVLEDDSPLFTQSLSRIFNLPKKPEPKVGEKDVFCIKDVEISNMTFTMKNHKSEEVKYRGGINWNDLYVEDLDLEASDLRFNAGIMSGVVSRLDFIEKSGWVCEGITGKATVGRGKTIIEDLRIKDRWSDIRMPMFMMSYKNSREFKYFNDRVRIDSEIDKSKLDFRTLWYFVPTLQGNETIASVSGKVGGHVTDIELEDLNIIAAERGFSGTVSGRISGLPEVEDMHIDARLNRFLLTTEGLDSFIKEWSPEMKFDMGQYAKGILFSMNGRVRGKLNRLDTDINISSLIGKAGADLRINDLLSKNKPLSIAGTLGTEDFDLGHVIGKDIIGRTTLRTGFDARLAGKGKRPEAKIDSLVIDRLYLNGYDYSRIAAAGEITDESFDGKVISNDPNLNFLFQGTFALSAKTHNSVYKFYANIGHADLNAINIDKRGVSKVRLQTQADFTSTYEGEVIGNMDIADIELENADGKYDIGAVNITSHSMNDDHSMTLRSNFASSSYSGTSPLSRFIKDALDITVRKEMPALFRNPEFTWENDKYRFDFVCHDMRDILAFVLPGLYVESGTSIRAEVSEDGQLNAHLNSGRIAFNKHYMKELNAEFDNHEDSFNADINCEEVLVSSIRLLDNGLQIHAEDNKIGIGFTYDNHSELENKGEFYLNSTLTREDDRLGVEIDIHPSSIYMNSKEWEIMPSTIRLKGKEMNVESFGLISGDEYIGLYGGTSETAHDNLNFELQRFDISLLNAVLGDRFGINGFITGHARLTSPLAEKGLFVDMLCDSTYIADIPLGVVSIGCGLNEEKGGFDIALINEIEGRSSISLSGNLSPKQRRVEAQANLDRLNIGYAKPFLSEVFSEMDGFLTGKVSITGPFDSLRVESENTRLDNAELTIAYTNVPYTADGAFHMDSKGVYFDDIRIRDRFNGTGSVEGSIKWNNLKDLNFDTQIRVNEIEGINLSEGMNDAFYGNIFATGNVSITGPASTMLLSVDAVTAKNGQIHIPMNAAGAGGKGTNLLKFTTVEEEIFIDPYEEMISSIQEREAEESNLTVKVRVNANPDVEAFVEIDKASGNVLSGRGNGVIDLDIGNDMFEINGDYTLTGGNYKFVAIGLVSRDFEIQDGSSVRFNGDILESTLDIDALYKTKASLSTLIADTTSVANRRTVECGINITEKISNPRLSFSIEIPDLDPMVKSRVESALSTDDKVQKQFLSLLLSNSFLPDEQSGIVNNTTLLYSNVSEAMANQLNNIFQKLDIPLDLGLNYQPNEKGNDIFDVAVSTQLFNNRVVVNGSVGNKQYNSGGTQDVVGDIDIEIKLDRSGSFRLNLFSHSADSYTNYLDNSQRSGVGLTYQTEFNNLGQFFRNMFMSKARRQAARQAEEQAIIDGGKVELKIEAKENNNKDERRKR